MLDSVNVMFIFYFVLLTSALIALSSGSVGSQFLPVTSPKSFICKCHLSTLSAYLHGVLHYLLLENLNESLLLSVLDLIIGMTSVINTLKFFTVFLLFLDLHQ